MKTRHFITALLLLSAVSAVCSADYKMLDKHALMAPAALYDSVEDLVKYLVKPAANDAEKARVIYRWITKNIAYDTDSYFGGERKDNTAEGVLKSGLSVCEGYANLFYKMSLKAGIECIKISGYSKGYGYTPGSRFSGKTDHAWNAVKIDGKWLLIDSTWGAGYIDKDKKFVFQYNDFYFLTPPEQFILKHYPEDPKFQYLDKTVTLREFEKSFMPHPEYFKYGIKIDDFKTAIINASNTLVIPVKSPEDIVLTVNLKDQDNMIKNAVIIQYVNDRYEININFPESKVYMLHIYAKDKNEKGLYPEVVKYQINVKRTEKPVQMFPATYENFIHNKCCLYSPLSFQLNEGEVYNFKVKIPNALEAMIISGKTSWIQMKKNNDEFEQPAEMRKDGMVIVAKFPGKGNKYSTIAQYECK